MFAIGLSSCPQVVSFVVAVEHNRREVSGTAIAATNMIVMFFGGLGMALFGVLLDWASGPGPLDPAANHSVSAYRVAMALLPACALFGACAALILRESINTGKPDPAEPMG